MSAQRGVGFVTSIAGRRSGEVEQHGVRAGVGGVAVVMIADVRRTRAVFVINKDTVLRSGSAWRGVRIPPIVRIRRGAPLTPHSPILAVLAFSAGSSSLSGHGQFLYVVPTPGDRHFENRDLWQLPFWRARSSRLCVDYGGSRCGVTYQCRMDPSRIVPECRTSRCRARPR